MRGVDGRGNQLKVTECAAGYDKTCKLQTEAVVPTLLNIVR